MVPNDRQDDEISHGDLFATKIVLHTSRHTDKDLEKVSS